MNDTQSTENIEFLDLEKVAEYLHVSMPTIYRYINPAITKNPLPSFKLTRRHIVVKKIELDAWIESYRKNGGKKE